MECFSLAALTIPYEKWNGKTRLYCDGEPTRTSIPGCNLKAQYQTDGYYVLATEYDCPFEEAVSVILLAKDFTFVASSTVPSLVYPVIGGPSYFFKKIVWNDARHFELHIENLPYFFHYTIRDFSIPFLLPPLIKHSVSIHETS